jgi:hypothetical protein
MSASGLPPACSRIRSVTVAEALSVVRRSTVAAASGPSGGNVIDGRSAPSNRRTSPSRAPNSTAIRSLPTRRATNCNASAEAVSSQWASSTRHRTGAASASSDSTVRQAEYTRKRSWPVPAPRPTALCKAARWCSGRASTPDQTGRRSWWIPANDSSDSASPLALVRVAILAPSPHNAQAWLFDVGERHLDVHADRSRSTGALDPFLRELHVGLGAALENVVLTARTRGSWASPAGWPRSA